MGTVQAKEPTKMADPIDVEELPHAQKGKPGVERVVKVFDGNNEVKVQRIHIEGLGRTRNDFIVSQVEDLFKAKTFKEVIETTGEMKFKLDKMGIYKSVGVFIDTSKGKGARADGLDITFIIKEGRRVQASAHTSVGNNEGSLVLGGKFPHTFGRAEFVTVEYSRGSRQSTGYNVNFLKPFGKKLDKRLTVSGFKSSAEFTLSSLKEVSRGTYIDFTFPNPIGQQALRWEGVWRESSCLTRTASFAVREESGHSLKSSLKHVFIRDTRDEGVYPSRGYLIKLQQELAGLTGGDVKFAKGEIDLQLNQRLFWDIIFSCSFEAGLMKALGDDRTRINDRFFLGGPTSVRGYNIRGIGPQTDGDFLGAESYWAAGVHLFSPLPFNPGKGGLGEFFRLHAFATAGNLCNLNLSDRNFQNHLMQLRENLRWSYGAGMLLRIGRVARFELNYCFPQSAQQTDKNSVWGWRSFLVASHGRNGTDGATRENIHAEKILGFGIAGLKLSESSAL